MSYFTINTNEKLKIFAGFSYFLSFTDIAKPQFLYSIERRQLPCLLNCKIQAVTGETAYLGG